MAQLALELAGVGVFEYDPQTGEQRFSLLCLRIWGLEAQEAPSPERLLALMHPEDRHLAQRAVDSLSPSGPGEFAIVHRIVRPDSALRWIETHGRTVFADNGQERYAVKSVGTMVDVTDRVMRLQASAADLSDPARGTLGTFIDLTERLGMQEELRASEARYRATFENAAIGIAHVGLDGRWLHFNDAVCKITGHTRESLSQLTFADITHPQDLEVDRESARRMMSGELDTYSTEKRYVRPDGSSIWVSLTVSALRDRACRLLHFVSIIEDISARKRVEEALEERSEELRQTLQTAATGLTRLDSNLRYLLANSAYAKVAGVPLEQIIGHTMHEVLGPAALARVRPHIDRVLTGEIVEYEAELPWTAAGPGWIHAVYSPWVESDGTVSGWVASITDITARKQAEKALRASEERYRTLFLNMAEEVHLWKLERDERGEIRTWRLVDVNPAALENWGKRLEDVQGKTVETFFPGAVAHFRPVVEKIMREGVPHSYETYFPELKQYLRLTSVPIGDYFLSTGADISEGKNAQIALVEREEQLRLATDAAEVGLWDVDLVTDTLFWPARVKGMFGISPDVPVSLADFYAGLHPEDRERTSKAFAAALDPQRRALYDVEYRTVGKEDGIIRWVAAKGRGIFDSGGRCVRVIGTAIDITGRKQVQTALEEANRQKDEFLAMLAHELRNPLAPIGTASELLARTLRDDSRSQAAVGMIKRQFTQLTRLVDDLLDVSRITQGRIPLQIGRVDLSEVIAQAVETVEPQLRDKRHRLSITADNYEPLYVNGDFARLVQCVANLLTNAIKYTDAGGQLSICSRGSEQYAVIEVSDSGMGISAELLPRVFDMFVQSERTLDRAQGGLGIGLAVVKRLIQMHEGTVVARSEGVGCGSQFEIRLPRLQVPVPAKGEETTFTSVRRRVLIVDDNVDAADSLSMLLAAEGHETEVSYRPTEALARAAAFQPDVALLDIGLPEMDGYQLAQRLRAIPELSGLRLLALSGYGQLEDRQRSQAAGFDGHLVKPIDLAALQRALGGDGEDDEGRLLRAPY